VRAFSVGRVACEELGVQISDADAVEFVPPDELEDFSWRGERGLWQLPDEAERVLAALQVSEHDLDKHGSGHQMMSSAATSVSGHPDLG